MRFNFQTEIKRVAGYSDSTKVFFFKQLNFISKYWQISCLSSANKSFWLFQVFWKRKWDGLWGNGLRPRKRSSLWPINLDWCVKKKKKDNKWDQWFRLRRSAPLLKMLMTRKQVNWKNFSSLFTKCACYIARRAFALWSVGFKTFRPV